MRRDMFKYGAMLLLLLSLLTGCSKNTPIKDEGKFASVYVDILVSMEKNRGDMKAIENARQKIFAQYDTSEEQYKATLEYYNQNPEKWKEFYTKVNDRINSLRKKS